MRILLLHPPAEFDVSEAYRTESLGLGYIASVLRRDGHDVEVLDAHLQCLEPKKAVRQVLERDFDCLGITAANVHKKVLVSIVRAVRRRRPDATLVAGGYLPTLSPEQLLGACPELDFLIRGEGEAVTSDVFARIERGEEPREAPGVAFSRNKTPVLNPLPPLIQDLDSLPFPSHDALDQAAAPTSALISSSRGCYRRCSFCCSKVFYGLSGGRAPRFRRPERVVDEIESVIRATGVRDFWFVDDNFIGPGAKTRERVVRIAEEIRARKLTITFKIECRADEIDEDILNLLKEAGLTKVFLGIESGVQRQLDSYDKRITVEQNKRAIEMVQRSGIGLGAGFIMIDPYVTLAEIMENVEFMTETKLWEGYRPMSFMNKLTVYRGVPLAERLRADGLLREKGVDLDYIFRNPWVRLLSGAALPLAACARFLKYVSRLLQRRRLSARQAVLERPQDGSAV